MQSLAYLLFGFSGFAGSVLLSYVGHLWLPKTELLWVFQVSGVIILWAVIAIALFLFAAWSVSTAANVHTQSDLEFGFAGLVQSLMPAAAGFILILLINGVALWLL